MMLFGAVVALQGRRLAGHVSYTLDDPYIHLRVSEMIRSGHYGLEPGSAASPSSSILWPFLLAPFAAFSWHAAVPLVINLLCVGATVPIVSTTLRRSWNDPHWQRWTTPVAFTLCFVANVVGTAMTGMEHSLQTLLAATMALGIVGALRGDRLRWWFWLAVVVGPVVRYEAVLVSGAAVAVAWIVGERRRPIIAVAGIATAWGGFAAFLMSLGLDPLPSSVLVKSQSGLANVVQHGTVVSCLLVALIVVARNLHQRNDRVGLVGVLVVIAVFGGHMLFASTDGIRYITSITVFALVILAGTVPTLLQPVEPVRLQRAVLGVVAVLAVWPGAWRAVAAVDEAPVAAAQISQQQCEMHRLVVEHLREPIAANDIGCVSYRNPYRVLDLWGLASQEAREARLEGHDRNWIEPLVRRNDVHVAMIYTGWFEDQVPESWTLVAQLWTTTPGYAAAPVVDLYATDAAAAKRLRTALEDWQRGDRPGAYLQWAQGAPTRNEAP